MCDTLPYIAVYHRENENIMKGKVDLVMALTIEERKTVTAALMRIWSEAGKAVNCLKQDLFDGTDNVDAWIEANQVSFNTSLPVVVQTGIDASMKADMFYAVARKRTGRKVEQED